MRQLKISQATTDRNTLSIDKYLIEISKDSPLNSYQEVAITERIKNGDTAAIDILIRANLRFVVSVAKQYQFRGVELCDLISSGNVGIIKAAHRFDSTRGFKFISYAVWWIRQSIMQLIGETSRMIRLPMNRVGDMAKVYREVNAFDQKWEREPTVEELAEILDIPQRKLKETMIGAKRHLSYNDSPPGEDYQLVDTMASNNPPSDSDLIRESMRKEIAKAIRHLQEIERDVISLSFGIDCEPRSLAEIATAFWTNTDKIRQVMTRALNKLNKHRKLREYL